MTEEIREIPENSGKFYTVTLDDTGAIVKPPKFIEPKPTEIVLDELVTSKLFLKYASEIQAWIDSSKAKDVLRSMLSRQSSVVDKTSLQLLKALVEKEREDRDVITDVSMIDEIIEVLDSLMVKLV